MRQPGSPFPQPRTFACRTFHLVFVLAFCISTMGCFGPMALQHSRLRYNESYRLTNDQEILLNIVRLRYADSPVFIDLPNITSQFQASATGLGVGGVDGQGPGPTRLGLGEIFLKDAPTLSFTPRSGQQIGRRLMAPLTAELLRTVSPGSNTELFLLAAVNNMNDVRNAPMATSLDPSEPENNETFRQVAALFRGLQSRGAVELRTATFDTDKYAQLPLAQVRGKDLLEATQNGKVFRAEGDQAHLIKREKILVLTIQPREVDSFEVQELARLLGLKPGRSYYKIVTQENDDIEPDEPPGIQSGDTIYVGMRSLWQLMTFLSKGVEVPPEHYQKGVVSTIVASDGTVHDWSELTRGFFRVRVSKHRPWKYDVAVKFRGYWFYITESDIRTRATLSLLELILELQESESERTGPLLTLPVG